MKILSLILSIFVSGGAPGLGSASGPKQEPDVAVYGGVVIDLGAMRERSSPSSTRMEDCSTNELRCVAGEVFRLVVPRICKTFEQGETFVSGPITTTVLATYPRVEPSFGPPYGYIDVPPGMGPMTVLGNPDQRWVVYIYSRSSLAAIYYDPKKEADLYGVATEGGIPALQNFGDRPRQYLGLLETIRPVFQCER